MCTSEYGGRREVVRVVGERHSHADFCGGRFGPGLEGDAIGESAFKGEGAIGGGVPLKLLECDLLLRPDSGDVVWSRGK